MLNYYQPWLWPFLHFKKTQLPVGIRRIYYHSFEDGLWDLLNKKSVPKGSLFLVPDFYCMDVLENIEKHGYRYQFYSVDKNFQIEESTFIDCLKKYHPQVVILFHAAGISCQLMKQKKWLSFAKKMLILEDSVQRLVNPAEVRLLTDNHFLMDSLRKVSPLPGSFLYGTEQGLAYVPSRSAIFNAYTWSSFFYFWLFRLCLQAGFLFRNTRLVNFAHIYFLKKHDDIIGDSLEPARGFWFFEWLSKYLDYEKLKLRKREQVAYYWQCFAPLWKMRKIYPLKITSRDWGELHVFPVGFDTAPTGFIEYLHQRGIVVWFKFPDAPWSKQQKTLFLPLGFHVKNVEIKTITKVISSYLSRKHLLF